LESTTEISTGLQAVDVVGANKGLSKTNDSLLARKVFHSADEPLLTYNEDDGKKIEPEVFMPVVPMPPWSRLPKFPLGSRQLMLLEPTKV
jgi:hypothetical protein